MRQYLLTPFTLLVYHGTDSISHDSVASVVALSVRSMPVLFLLPLDNMVVAGNVSNCLPLSVLIPATGCNININPSGIMYGCYSHWTCSPGPFCMVFYPCMISSIGMVLAPVLWGSCDPHVIPPY